MGRRDLQVCGRGRRVDQRLRRFVEGLEHALAHCDEHLLQRQTPAGTRLYRCLDHLLPHKTKIEQHLKQRYGELFDAEFDVLLYDLTSTYVEGSAEANPLMRRGHSRDHRPDCKQLIIALIVNVEGFPFSYEVFDGNRADVTTLETILRVVERKYGRARRVWVFDRGIVSEENLQTLRRRGGEGTWSGRRDRN